MIGEKFKAEVIKELSNLLDIHLPAIKEAYIKSESGISVSMPIKIQPNAKKSGFIDVEVGIRFTNMRTRDSRLLEISETQNPLSEKLVGMVRKMDKDLRKKGMEMEVTGGGKSVTLGGTHGS